MEKEKRFTGQVSLTIYWYYVKSAGVLKFFLMVFSLIASIVLGIGSTWWVTIWA